MIYICILGRQPALGLAELESRFGAEALQTVTSDIAQLETDQDVAVFDQIGGSQKVAQLLTRLDTTDWNKVLRSVQKSLPSHLLDMPEGKITLGLSVHGFTASAGQVNAAALSLKKVIKQTGRSARIVPNAETTLNTAQVIHNKLAGENGIEIVIVKEKNQTVLAQTVWVQDIEAYRRRDQERPLRDARVGMLPPKLAQIILNLAYNDEQADDPAAVTVLDPFCGTGVVLQEALLNGNQVAGSDLDPRMVEYTNKNLQWFRDTVPELHAKTGDATTMNWRCQFDLIASETYLGRALSSMPDHETLQKIVTDCDTIHTKFLKNVARQTDAGFRMCLAVPAWYTRKGFRHLPMLDHLEELGYNRVSFVHAKTQNLVYHRENQIVARELVVLTRR